MKIALIGYGKMGKTIEALGLDQGHTFPLIIDEFNRNDLNAERLREVDVAIEFTAPKEAPGNVMACLDFGIPVVSGTTGWNERLEEIKAHCLNKEGAFFYASNFSIGVNILFAMNRHLTRIMNRFPEYQVSIQEVHHIHKLDAPSGTAIVLAEQIIEESNRVNRWRMYKSHDDKPGSDHADDAIIIEAIREGEEKGIHTVRYESDVDIISLGHYAKSRNAFATGVLAAAQFIYGIKGVYGMNDLLNL